MRIAGGDRDCSSAVISSYRAAGLNVNATYTGNMKAGFLATGKFEVWDTRSTSAQRGDIYLNEANHTAMCVDDGSGEYGYDALAQFSINERGGITGGQVGDQTGRESAIGAYYDYPWDCTLHCTDRELADVAATVMEHLCECPNHGYAQDARWGDGTTEEIGGAPSQQPAADVPVPEYRIFNRESGWLSWMKGLDCSCDCGDDFAGEPGCWAYDFEARNLGANGWYRISRADGSESTNESGNVNSPIWCIEVYYDTPSPDATGYYRAKYQAHWLGDSPDWGKWEFDDEDGGAGKDAQSPIDMFRLTIEKS